MKINEVIGPHENKELEMMLNDEKPVALVSKEGFQDFVPYIKKGRFSFGVNTRKSPEIPSEFRDQYIVAQPKYSDRIEEIKNIYKDIDQKGYMEKDNHRRMGELLGYSEQDIEEFIEGIEKIS